MKISYNWLKSIIPLDIPVQETAVLLTGCGLEVEGIEIFETVPGGLKGLVIGLVADRQQHPGADRLSLCKVDVGAESILSIVCGAPNVAAGQKVIVAQVGTTIYPTAGEPFTISKAKIRGEVSEGMICADDEIGLGKDHSGIRVLPEDAPVGMMVRDYLKIESDQVLEIGLTPNRGDAASILGVARDLRALTGKSVLMPESIIPKSKGKGPVSVDIKDVIGCPRYSGLYLKGVKIGESPLWLQNRLKAIGIRPKNNIIDITNHTLHELGQPIHAFDAAKINDGIIVRRAEKGEKITTLDAIERKLEGVELLICDHKKPLALAGIFGGMDSGVSDNTTDIFIESAFFDPGIIRKGAKTHGLNTDASFRYERGTDPEVTVFALQRTASLILQMAGGEIVGDVIDTYPKTIQPHDITFRPQKLRSFGGVEIDDEEIERILVFLDISVDKNGDQWQLKVPARKLDVTREVDIIEEVLRIFGYDNIPGKSHITFSDVFREENRHYKATQKVGDYLADNGFLEMMTNPLSSKEFQENPATTIELLNPLSSELGVLRDNMLSTALQAVAFNHHRKNSNLKFFEFGKTYFKHHNTYKEKEQLFLIITGNIQPENWNTIEEKVSYFHLKAFVVNAIKKAGTPVNESTLAKYSNIELVPDKLMKAFDLKGEIWYAQIDWNAVIEDSGKESFKLKPISKFPEVRRDLSLVLDQNAEYLSIENLAYRTVGKRLKSVGLFDAFEGPQVGEGKKSYSISCILGDDEKTMTDNEIDRTINRLIQVFEKELNATIRR
jgi:phenylalanyl-tRNA synthetase beta chain